MDQSSPDKGFPVAVSVARSAATYRWRVTMAEGGENAALVNPRLHPIGLSERWKRIVARLG